MSWIEDIKTAITNLGGMADLKDIYAETRKIRPLPHIKSFDDTVRGCIEEHSSDSKKFKNKSEEKDLFYSVEGIGGGIWGLRSLEALTPVAPDSVLSEGDASPEKVEQQTYRILRDTKLARQLKMLHSNRCQVCGDRIEIKKDEYYSEAHHIKPLGSPHHGPDVPGNIIVLCPNHHVMLDYGIMRLDFLKIKHHPKHKTEMQFINYHNEHIAHNSVR